MQTDQVAKKESLIVIDGIDGSGKTTQVNLLSEYLSSKNIPHEVINFPRYEDNLYGKLIRRYLNGEFGGVDEVNPYLMALSYAGDRALAKPLIESWLNAGKIVIVNRYVSASKAHLGANIPERKREEFMRWIDELEYQTNNLPKENLTILLKVDPKKGQKNVKGRHVDIHEQDLNHLKIAQELYLELSEAEENWKVIDCMVGESMQSVEAIHKLVVEILDHYLVS